MKDVYIAGTGCTAFGKLAGRSFQDLTREEDPVRPGRGMRWTVVLKPLFSTSA